jgi:hypothetical protein
LKSAGVHSYILIHGAELRVMLEVDYRDIYFILDIGASYSVLNSFSAKLSSDLCRIMGIDTTL